MSDKAWSGKTGGTGWMQRSLIRMFRFINPALLYPVVWVWVLGYIATDPHGRKGIWHYWRRRLGYPPLRAAWNLYRNYVCFGKAILDRFAAWAGRKVQIRYDGIEILDTLSKSTDGFVVISSHIGNQELAGYNIRMPKPMYVLTYMGDTATVNAQREQAFAAMGLHIIPVEKDGSHILDMHRALQEGNIVSVHGDRMFYGAKTLRVPLLGEEASFPEGCFKFAAVEQKPVVSVYMMRERCDCYTLYARLLSDGQFPDGNTKQNAMHLLEAYTREMEQILRKYPHQWFHFYEFWKQ